MPPDVIANTKLRCQLHSRFFSGQPVELRSKINHIPIRLTAEAMEASVNLHAGIFVVVERAEAHPVPPDRNPILCLFDRFCCLKDKMGISYPALAVSSSLTIQE